MDYFKAVSVLLGAGMAAGGMAAVFFVDGLRRLMTQCYPETRPRWIPVTAAAMLLWTLGTWGAFFQAVSMEHFVVTLVVSLGLLKVTPLVFYYQKTREVLWALLQEPLAFRAVALSSGAVGAGLLVMGIFF